MSTYYTPGPIQTSHYSNEEETVPSTHGEFGKEAKV